MQLCLYTITPLMVIPPIPCLACPIIKNIQVQAAAAKLKDYVHVGGMGILKAVGNGFPQALIPVSYTHLDVYKRQSMLIALFNTQSIVSILMFCFTLRAAGSFFPYVMGHYWKKASTAGTIASLIAGTIVVVYLEHVSKGMLFGIKFSQPIICLLYTSQPVPWVLGLLIRLP